MIFSKEDLLNTLYSSFSEDKYFDVRIISNARARQDFFSSLQGFNSSFDQLKKEQDAEQAGFYFGVCPRDNNQSGKTEDISLVQAVWIDLDSKLNSKHLPNTISNNTLLLQNVFDCVGSKCYVNKLSLAQLEKAYEGKQLSESDYIYLKVTINRLLLNTNPNVFKKLSLYPTIIVNSGHGLHAYWVLKQPISKAESQPILLGLCKHFDSDPSVAEVARIMRMPDTINYGIPTKPAPCTILEINQNRYDIADFAVLNSSAKYNFLPCFQYYWDNGTVDGERHSVQNRFGNMLKREGYSDDKAKEILLELNSKCYPPLEEQDFNNSTWASYLKADNSSYGCDTVMKNHCNHSCKLYKQDNKVSLENHHILAEEKIWEANEFLVHDFKEPEAYCDGLIFPQGITLVAGEPKIGKTKFILDCAVKLATGKYFLEQKVTRPYKVLFIQAEHAKGRLQKRLKALLSNNNCPKDNLFFLTSPAINLVHTFDYQTLKLKIDKVMPDIIFLDPMVEFFDGIENNAQDMRLFINSLRALIQGTNRAIVLTHHLKKPNSESGTSFNSIRGSSALRGAYETGILLTKGSANRVKVSFDTRNEPIEKIVISFNDNLEIEYKGKANSTTTVTNEHIWKFISDNGGKARAKEIKEGLVAQLGCGEDTVKKHLGVMKNASLLDKGTSKNSPYTIPEKYLSVMNDNSVVGD